MFAAPLGISVAGAAPVVPSVVQQQFGTASGTVGIDVYLGVEGDRGSYTSSGQLGRGQYRFEFDYHSDNRCDHPTDAFITNGTAELVRSDGAVLRGTVTETQSCVVGVNRVTYAVTLTHGSRDLVGAHLVFTGAFSNFVVATPTGDRADESFLLTGTTTSTTRDRLLDGRERRDGLGVRWRRPARQRADRVDRDPHRAHAHRDRLLGRRHPRSRVRVRRRPIVRQRRSPRRSRPAR